MKKPLAYLLAPIVVAFCSMSFPAHARELPPEAEELKKLYEELQGFRYNPQFHQVGYGDCCEFHSWMKRNDEVRDRIDFQTSLLIGFDPFDLYLLGKEYMDSKGQPTEESKRLEQKIKLGLKPWPKPRSGFGVVTLPIIACNNLKTLVELPNDNDCFQVYTKAEVEGPLETHTEKYDDFALHYYKIKTSDGVILWVGEDYIEFQE